MVSRHWDYLAMDVMQTSGMLQVRAGTGLGLAISRGFIEAMDGTITASNRIDRSGAVFTITLPVPYAAKPMDTAA